MGELLELDLDFEDVVARIEAGLVPEPVARLALPLGHATLLPAEAEARQLDLGDGDRNQVLPLAADQLSLGQVLSQVLPDHASHDLRKR